MHPPTLHSPLSTPFTPSCVYSVAKVVLLSNHHQHTHQNQFIKAAPTILTTVAVFAKNNYYYAESQPASHYSIPQAAQITKHLLPGMVAQLVKIPARSLILLLAAFTHKYILSLSDHRPTKSPTV